MGRAYVKIAAELWKLCGPRPGEIIEIVSNDIPPDSELESVGYDVRRDVLEVILSSPSLPLSSDDEPIELNGPVFQIRKS